MEKRLHGLADRQARKIQRQDERVVIMNDGLVNNSPPIFEGFVNSKKRSMKKYGRLFTCPLCKSEIKWNEYGICDSCRIKLDK